MSGAAIGTVVEPHDISATGHAISECLARARIIVGKFEGQAERIKRLLYFVETAPIGAVSEDKHHFFFER